MARVKTRTSMSTKKKAASITAIVLCMALLLGGAFAWKDFSQAFTNIFKQHPTPDVLLHDDFTPNENKDVYVENTGDVPTYVRISFYEYLQIGNEVVVGDTTKTPAESLKDKSTWKKHLYTTMPGVNGIVSDWNLESDKYYDWFMTGAQKLYLPGTSEIDDINYKALGYVAGNIPARDDGKANSGNGYALKNTAAATSVISMATWVGMTDTVKEQYKGWILDTDGYAYWSQKLLPGEATNLLLDNVLPKTGAIMDDNAYYAIDVRLQATNATEVYKLYTDKDTGATDITDDAKDWLDGDADKKVPENIIDDPKGSGLTEEEKDFFRQYINESPINTAKIIADCDINNEKDVADAYAIALEELNKAIVGGDAAKAEELARAAESLKNIAARIRNKYPTTGELPATDVITVDENGFAKVVDEATGDTLLNAINFPDSVLIDLLMSDYVSLKLSLDTFTYGTNTTNVSSIDTNKDGKLTNAELNAVEEIYLARTAEIGDSRIGQLTSLEGIELFPNVIRFELVLTQVTDVNLILNPELETLVISNSPVADVNIENCKKLKNLIIDSLLETTSIPDVTQHTDLERLRLSDISGLISFDASDLSNLTYLLVYDNPNLTSIELAESNVIEMLRISNTGFTGALDVSDFSSLEYLYAWNCPNLTSVDASGCTSLFNLRVEGTAAEPMSNLEWIDITDTAIPTTVTATPAKGLRIQYNGGLDIIGAAGRTFTSQSYHLNGNGTGGSNTGDAIVYIP